MKRWDAYVIGFPAHAGMDPGSAPTSAASCRLPRTRGDGPRFGFRADDAKRASPHTRGWTPRDVPRRQDGAGFPAHAGMDPRRSCRRASSRRLPRTRGDGPRSASGSESRSSASPHTRGWTLLGQLPPVRAPGFPAHAGMDPRPAAPPAARTRLPRTRGDGPYPGRPRRVWAKASPHTRGWTPGTPGGTWPPAGFPAHAGMDPAAGDRRRPPRRLPRTRGDGPAAPDGPNRTISASPHTRGWTRRVILVEHALVGFPAHAGMDPGRSRSPGARAGLPRTRGDGPDGRLAVAACDAASPHTRGWTLDRRAGRLGSDGFPAHAGMDPCRDDAPRSPRRLPRTRGDGPGLNRCTRTVAEASPHTRGWTPPANQDVEDLSGFPAHAGMDPSSTCRTSTTTWLPRTRGDGPIKALAASAAIAASPHTRGWTLECLVMRQAGRGFPAHAGMDPSGSPRSAACCGLPRTRGDGPRWCRWALGIIRASPHTRGWTHALERRRPGLAGFPAHAGMDPGSPARARAAGRLPRTRGDGPGVMIPPPRVEEASPHTRGWTPDDLRGRDRGRGFPAHAGMDPGGGTPCSPG